MTSGKVIGALAPLAAAGAFAGGMLVQQRHAPAEPQGILGAGVFVPASAGAQSGFYKPGSYKPGGRGYPGGITRPGGYARPGGQYRPGGFAHPGSKYGPGRWSHPGFNKP